MNGHESTAATYVMLKLTAEHCTHRQLQTEMHTWTQIKKLQYLLKVTRLDHRDRYVKGFSRQVLQVLFVLTAQLRTYIHSKIVVLLMHLGISSI